MNLNVSRPIKCKKMFLYQQFNLLLPSAKMFLSITKKCRSPSDLRWSQCQQYNSPSAHRNFTNRDEYIDWIPTYPTSGPEVGCF